MIGQKNLLSVIANSIELGFPHFCILEGQTGSGKHLIVKEISKLLKCPLVEFPDISVSAVREMLNISYNVSNKTVYVLYDCDTMSIQAKNALLKVTEEPPNNAYIILTVQDVNSFPDTIRSRGIIYKMDNYLNSNLIEYIQGLEEKVSDKDLQRILDLCDTPDDVNTLIATGVSSFYADVEHTVDNIEKVSGSSCFSIGNKLILKKDGDGYDVRMFLRAFMCICIKRMEKDPIKYSAGVSITSKYLRELNIKGVSKPMLADSWILDIRQAWLK